MHCLVVLVFIHFCCRTAESRIVCSNQTTDTSSKPSTPPSRSETASVAGYYSSSYASFVDKADRNSSLGKTNSAVQKSEERSFPGSWTGATDLWRSWKMREWLSKQVHPAQAFDKLRVGGTKKWSVDLDRFKRWLRYVDMHRAQNGHFGDDEVVKLLVKYMYAHSTGEIDPLEKEVRMKRLVQLIAKLRPNMEDRADQMLYMLFRSDPSDATSELLMDVWLEKKVSPEQVFEILHLDMPHFVETLPAYPVLWLRYIDRYNKRYMAVSHPFEEPVKLLRENMGLEIQSTNLLQEIGRYPELDPVADQLKTLRRSRPNDLWRSKSTSNNKKRSHLWRSKSTSHTSRGHPKT